MVVGWSYGGWVGPAATESFLKKDGEGAGVVGYVYAASPIPPHGNITAAEINVAYNSSTWYDPDVLAQANITYVSAECRPGRKDSDENRVQW